MKSEIEIPDLLMVLLSLPFNKLPWSKTEERNCESKKLHAIIQRNICGLIGTNVKNTIQETFWYY